MFYVFWRGHYSLYNLVRKRLFYKYLHKYAKEILVYFYNLIYNAFELLNISLVIYVTVVLLSYNLFIKINTFLPAELNINSTFN